MRFLNNPIISWLKWIVVLVAIFLIFMRSFFFSGLEADESGISLVILVFFVIGVIVSLFEAIKLGVDQYKLDLIEDKGLEATTDLQGRIPDLLKKIDASHKKNQPVDVATIIDSFDTYHGASIRSLSVTSNILVTFGLIGTMIGLITSIAGLNDLVSSIGTSQIELMKGMKTTINGMGVAFYTTFFGAFFGGILLKILSSSLLSSLSKLSAKLQSFISLELNPAALPDMMSELNKEISSLSETWRSLTEAMSSSTLDITDKLQGFNRSLQTADLQMQNFSQTFLKADIGKRSADLSNQTANARTTNKPAQDKEER